MFPGQGSQFPGMAKDLYESNETARRMLERANEILGFSITDIMFGGTAEDLKQTKVTQPAIFLHSVVLAACCPDFRPDMVAGHSLGEFSALVAAGALDFEDGLRLVSIRANAMQKACEMVPGTMAAVLALPTEKIEEICAQVDGVVVPANYNCDGQVVISGECEAVEKACVLMKEAGARRALVLPVGGAFHEKYLTEIKLFANDRSGMLVDISKIFTERNINILSLNCRTNKQGTATIAIGFEIHGKEELGRLVDKLRQVQGVLDIERTTG